MKKVILYAAILAVVMSMTACGGGTSSGGSSSSSSSSGEGAAADTAVSESKEPSSKTAVDADFSLIDSSKMGSNPQNIYILGQNNNTLGFDDEYVYHTCMDINGDFNTYRTKYDGSGTEKVFSDTYGNINIYGGNVYYSCSEGGGRNRSDHKVSIHKFDLNTHEDEIIYTQSDNNRNWNGPRIVSMYIYDGYLFFVNARNIQESVGSNPKDYDDINVIDLSNNNVRTLKTMSKDGRRDIDILTPGEKDMYVYVYKETGELSESWNVYSVNMDALKKDFYNAELELAVKEKTLGFDWERYFIVGSKGLARLSGGSSTGEYGYCNYLYDDIKRDEGSWSVNSGNDVLSRGEININDKENTDLIVEHNVKCAVGKSLIVIDSRQRETVNIYICKNGDLLHPEKIMEFDRNEYGNAGNQYGCRNGDFYIFHEKENEQPTLIKITENGDITQMPVNIPDQA